MSMFKRAWDAAGWLIGGYTVYRQLKTMDEAKDELYTNLSPEQRAEWDRIFGKPNAAPASTAPQIDQIKAGT